MIDASILRAMLAAGATAEMIVVAVEAAIKVDEQETQRQREYERERKREYRMSRMSRGQPRCPGDKRKKEPKKENIYINNKSLEGVQGKPLSELSQGQPIAEPLFDEFWEVYPRKVGKGAARKAYRHALKRASADDILAGAKRYRPDPQFTKHPTTWLNADCWLDEPEKPKNTVLPGPWKPIEREPECPKISEKERQANLQKLAKIRFRGKGIDVKNG